ncbi:cyanophycinase [uncultured Aquimarina sp.]|uniref:cyanophycinase n=1 Tax=uncultured Aquimarina sp. TaxID=575652 RepID=UPI002636619E|nr:cyanophycinase [uncultured Aquimarina sp.]
MKSIYILFLIILTASCNTESSSVTTSANQKEDPVIAKGKLFIIGGGKRPKELVQELIHISKLDKEHYAVILPMASQEPDSAIFYARKQFTDLGIKATQVKGFNFKKGEEQSTWIEIIKKAGLIYIPGGDQTRFMNSIINTPLYTAVHEAYQNGATIAGTSAGAAIMGDKMITGIEHKHPEYTGDFKTIEADNIEITKGMGFLKNTIIDQHFIKRMRMNRLISTALENPYQIAIGIDESTAIVVEGKQVRVVGVSQVIILKNPNNTIEKHNGLLGGDHLELSVKLPGSTFGL